MATSCSSASCSGYPTDCEPPCSLVKQQLSETTCIAKDAYDTTTEEVAKSLAVLRDLLKEPNLRLNYPAPGDTLSGYSIEDFVLEFLARSDCPAGIVPARPGNPNIPSKIEPVTLTPVPELDSEVRAPDVQGVLEAFPDDLPPLDVAYYDRSPLTVPEEYVGASVQVPDRSSIDASVKRDEMIQDLSPVEDTLDSLETRIEAALAEVPPPPDFTGDIINQLIVLKDQYRQHYLTERATVLAEVKAQSESTDDGPLFQAMQQRLGTYLIDGYTHSRGIWEQMRARERDQSIRTSRQEQQQIMDGWAARGWELPTVAMAGQLAAIEQRETERFAKVSRDMSITESEQVLQGIKTSVDQIMQSEQMLWAETRGIQGHVTDVARWSLEFKNALYELMLRKGELTARYVDLFINIARTRLEKAAEALRQELEPEQLHLRSQDLILNDDRVTYGDQIRAKLSDMENLRANYDRLISRSQLALQDETRLLTQYGNNLQNHSSRNRTREVSTTRFNSRVAVEELKSRVYNDERQVFEAEVRAWGTEADALLKQQDQRIESEQRMPIQLYRTELDTYVAELQNYIRELDEQVKWYEAGVDAFSARSRAERDKHDSERDDYNAEAGNDQRNYALELDQARTNLGILVDKMKTLANAHLSAAQISAQLSAGYASATQTSASVSGRDTTNFSVTQAG